MKSASDKCEDGPKQKRGFHWIAREFVDTFGGPAQYLNERIRTSEANVSFEHVMRRLPPHSEIADYWQPGDILHNGQLTHFHFASLGWVPSVTTKPLPYTKTCLALADELLTHYCLTAEEPARVWAQTNHDVAYIT